MAPQPQLNEKSNNEKEADNSLVFSYLTLRNLIGFCGMLLPFILAFLPAQSSKYSGFEPSISDYFYTNGGDFLVVLMSVLGVFLFTYKGYTPMEIILTSIAGICAIGVAFVPTGFKGGDDFSSISVHTTSPGLIGRIFDDEKWHLGFAVVFLLCLAVISLKFFTRKHSLEALKKDNGKRTQKGKRNIVYKVCGWVMIICVGILVIYFIINEIQPIDLHGFPIIFVFEAIAVEAFGISWITKGETLWPDGEHYIKRAIKSPRTILRET